jgi:hypothetical protein
MGISDEIKTMRLTSANIGAAYQSQAMQLIELCHQIEAGRVDDLQWGSLQR